MPRRRDAAALALAVLLATAGCVAPPADDPTSDRSGADGDDAAGAGEGAPDPADGDGGVEAGDGTGARDGAGGERGDPGHVVATVADGDRRLATFALVVADTPAERRRGLMDRARIPRDGMVFVYHDEAPRTFWMKDTRVPLDMLFVAGNGTVLHVAHASPPPPGTDDVDLKRYGGVPARYVIEVARGTANASGIRPGATVTFDPRPTVASP